MASVKQPKSIEIHWLHDEHDCELCGTDYAEGAEVKFDGETILDLRPRANCYDAESWDRERVMSLILERLGFVVTEVEEE